MVSRFVEGSLGAAELADVEGHLARCEECVKLVADVSDALRPATQGPVADRGSPDDRPLAKDTRVGRYVILEQVGAGAMGQVYAALDPSLDRKVALKLLHARAATAPLEARLLREAKAMARLSHPDVITVHDTGKHGDRLFIAMEFVEGGTLRDWLRARPRTWREVLEVFTRAGRGLAQAHAAGIVHRDFKPDNVLVGADGRVRVTDFGLARTAQEDGAATGEAEERSAMHDVPPAGASFATRTGTLLGTPAYMAPEQLAGQPADVRSDVYGFCVALYEGLYGERPFQGQSLAALQREKSSGTVPPAPSGRGVPSRLRRALLVGLRPRPEDRYASMETLLDSLARSARLVSPSAAASVVLVAAAAATMTLGARRMLRARAPTVQRAVATQSAGCKSSRACVDAHHGDAYVCRPADGECVALASEDCAPRFEPEDLRDERTVWLGSMLPTKGDGQFTYGAMNEDGADLARREIARATSALTRDGASERVRRVALVACDDSKDPERAARHLADVGVPAIVGFGSGKEIEDLAGSLLIGRHVLSIATLTGNPLVTRLPQPADLPRMVWRTQYSVEASAEATVHFLHDVLEPRAGRRETRVTLARVDANMGTWFGEAFYRGLVFNGKPAVANGDAYREVTFSPGAPESVVAQTAARVVAAEPTFVVLLGGSADTGALVRQIEAAWSSTSPRPTYVFGADSLEPLAPFLGKSEDRRRRAFGVSSLSSQASNARFVMRFEAAHPGEATLTMNPGVTYDAFYLLAWAVFAIGDRPVTGPDLGRAFARLVPPGRPIENGPNDVFDGLAALARGESIDLDGPSGSLDFNLATGEAPADFALLCAGVDRDGSAARDVESGVVFRSKRHAVEGAMRCP